MAKQDERFIKVLNEGSTWTTNREIWVDKTTGVNYLWIASGYAGGLTPLLDAAGHTLVTHVPAEEYPPNQKRCRPALLVCTACSGAPSRGTLDVSADTFSAFPRFMQLPDQHDSQGDDEDGEYPDPADAQQELPVRGLPGLFRGGFFRGLLLFGQPLLLRRLPLELGLPGRFLVVVLRGLLLFGWRRAFFRLGLLQFLGLAQLRPSAYALSTFPPAP